MKKGSSWVVAGILALGGAGLAGCQSGGGDKPMAMSDQGMARDGTCCADTASKDASADVKHMTHMPGDAQQWEYSNFSEIDLDRIGQGGRLNR